jgi:hypothetical protein
MNFDDRVCEVLSRLAAADFAVLEPVLLPWVRREYRLRERDRAVVELAGCYMGRLLHGPTVHRKGDRRRDVTGSVAISCAIRAGNRETTSAPAGAGAQQWQTVSVDSIREVLAGRVGRNRRQRLPSRAAIIRG